MTDTAAIERLTGFAGLAAGYTDAYGVPVATSLDARQAILADFGLPSDTDASLARSLSQVEALYGGLVPPLVPIQEARPAAIPLQGLARDTLIWTLTDEAGATRSGRSQVASSDGRPVLRLPALRSGYYKLTVEMGRRADTATLICAPARCWQPDDLATGARYWGLNAQVYGLKSPHNIGIGTYRDVADAAAGGGALGASFFGLSPIHALFTSDRTKISPYSPSSRLFLEPMHIDASLLTEVALDDPRIQSLREAALVEHAGVWDALAPLLRKAWDAFRAKGVDPAFEAFRREHGAPLQAHATFEALSAHFAAKGAHWRGEWPQAYQAAQSPEVAEFQKTHDRDVAFHAWLQWIADGQLATAAKRARDSGMVIGLYRDLAVGADRGGSEVWAHSDRFGPTLSVGAPPDLLAPKGQNWGLPPLNPLSLARDGLAAFRELVVANMRHAGAIRIDHAFQLQRLFVIPNTPTGEGAYIAYPFESMLATLRLESQRARCMVVAEDLGTAPAGFTDAIIKSGLFGFRILQFERTEGGGFKSPREYPRHALAAVATHDLPTLPGWWIGLDTELRQAVGIYDTERADRERNERTNEKRALVDALWQERLINRNEVPEAAPLEPVLRYIARTRCALVGVQYEDVVGDPNQANLPGIMEGYPNWRRRLPADIETIAAPGGPLPKIAAAFAEEGRGQNPNFNTLAGPPPRATYRVQFHEGFTFDDAVRIVPYLAELGISHLYASPVQKARPGSTHGYDIVNHSAINPELGGEEGFTRLSEALREHGLGLVLDIVPNHTGVGGSDNDLWLKVLEWGEASPYAHFFDIDWERLGANRKLVVPFLGERYGEVLEKGDLKVQLDGKSGTFSVWHHEHRFPICPLNYPHVLDRALAALGTMNESAFELMAITDELRAMASETAPERRRLFPERGEELKQELAEILGRPDIAQAVEKALRYVNGSPDSPASFGTLHRLLETQSYRLAHWRVATSEINYRRFFDINSLAALRVEEPDVFDLTHQLVFRLVREGRIQGLRVDHVDGLADPIGYVRALQNAVGPGFYIVIEKILEPGEELRRMPIAGTTGYDVLNLIDGIFVDRSAVRAFRALYRDTSGMGEPYEALLIDAKSELLEQSFTSELEALVSDFKRVADADWRTRDFSARAISRALVEMIAHFPVYRTYLDTFEPSDEDVQLIESTATKAKESSQLPDQAVHSFIADVLLQRLTHDHAVRLDREWLSRICRRFQQLTGPVMAKSLEDTLFYRYFPLLSLNEVGGDPGHFGGSVEEFHRANAERATHWPDAMIATATHDTKRGEDARGRISALSEMPDVWRDSVATWEMLCAPLVEQTAAPDVNDRYGMLQALLGAWPVELLGDKRENDAIAAFLARMQDYTVKALRESKRHTSWTKVDDAYEAAAKDLLAGVLAADSGFYAAFGPIAQRLMRVAAVTGLSRIVLKCTMPGVPDTFQGTEFWDFSLVDPDNRRPVDYAARHSALDSSDDAVSMAHWRDGHVKQRVLARVLADRMTSPELYAKGNYAAVAVTGSRADNVVSFTRALHEDRLVTVVPRLVAGALNDAPLLTPQFWAIRQ